MTHRLPLPHRPPLHATRRPKTGLAGLALAVGLLLPAGTSATVLRFDQALQGGVVVPTASGGRLPPGYGDHVAGPVMPGPGGLFTYDEQGEGYTPQVQADFYATDATAADPRARLWASGYGSLGNVLFGEGPGIGGPAELFVHLVADPGFEVALHGFDLAAFGGADRTIQAIELWSGVSLLQRLEDVLVEGDTSAGGFSPIRFATPWQAPELLLRLDLSNLPVGARDNIGLDNLRFGQWPPATPVPEPASGLLVGAGLAAVVLARRRGRAHGRPA